MIVVNMFTGEPVAELTDGYLVASGSLTLPSELPLMQSRRSGDLIQDAYRMVRPGQRGYRHALDDWLLLEGLEIRD